MKNERGEISIIMVITAIVLIIMGGICVFMLTGDNGLFVPKKDEEITKNNTVNQNTVEQQNEINTVNAIITTPVE